VLAALARAARVRNVRPDGDASAALLALWQVSTNDSLRVAVLHLATQWKLEALKVPALFAAFCTPENEELRIAGGTAFAQLGGADVPKLIDELANPSRVVGERVAAAVGFLGLDLSRAAAIAADILAGDSGGKHISNLLPPFLQRQGGASALASALAAKPPARDAARLALRLMNIFGPAGQRANRSADHGRQPVVSRSSSHPRRCRNWRAKCAKLATPNAARIYSGVSNWGAWPATRQWSGRQYRP
jgi:hypothetical protein